MQLDKRLRNQKHQRRIPPPQPSPPRGGSRKLNSIDRVAGANAAQSNRASPNLQLVRKMSRPSSATRTAIDGFLAVANEPSYLVSPLLPPQYRQSTIPGHLPCSD